MKTSLAGERAASAVLALCLVYTALWFYTAQLVRQEISFLYADAGRYGLSVDGPMPVVSGFPGRHRFVFSGEIAGADGRADIPQLAVSGFFFPGAIVTADFAQGFKLSGTKTDPEIWSPDQLRLKVKIPWLPPRDFTAPGLRAWTAGGGRLEIAGLLIRKRGLLASAQGTVTLDANLQPSGRMDADISGDYPDFLLFLQQKNVIDAKKALLAGAILTGLSRPDLIGRSTIFAKLTLQDQNLYLGPLKLAKMPDLAWPAP
jgi:hypothetical protein